MDNQCPSRPPSGTVLPLAHAASVNKCITIMPALSVRPVSRIARFATARITLPCVQLELPETLL